MSKEISNNTHTLPNQSNGIIPKNTHIAQNTRSDPDFLKTFKQQVQKITTRNVGEIEVAMPEIVIAYNKGVRKKINDTINTTLSKLNEVFKEDIDELANFAILGLGSLARGEMLPGSDFEFAILLDREFDPTSYLDAPYFQNFTFSLSKTLEQEGLIKMDEAGTHPNGYNHRNKLIGDVDQLFLFQKENFHKVDEKTYQDNPYLFTILGNPILLYTNDASKMNRIYEKYIHNINGIAKYGGFRLEHTANSLRDSLEKYSPLQSRYGKEKDSIFNPKYDFYRIPNLILDHLDLYYALEYDNNAEPRTTSLRLEKLHSKNSTLATSQLMRINSSYALAMYLRSISSKEIDLTSMKYQQYKRISDVIDKKLYKSLEIIYNEAISFSENHKQDKEYESSYIKGLKFKNDGNIESALREFSEAVSTDPLNYYGHHRKAQIERKLGEHDKASLTLESALKYTAGYIIEESKCLRLQGQVFEDRKLYAEAKEKYFQMIKVLLEDSDNYKASSDTPKTLLIKAFMGLSRLELDIEDRKKYEEAIHMIEKIAHFGNVKPQSTDDLNKDLRELSEDISNLIHNSYTKKRIRIKHLYQESNQEKQTPVIYQVIQQDLDLIDRKDSQGKIKDLLNYNNKPVCITSALAGMGKSQLAKKYAEENKNNYAITYFFDAAEGSNLDRQFKKLAQTLDKNFALLGIDKTLSKPQTKTEKVIKKVLETLSLMNKDFLLIFDDAKNLASIDKYIPKNNSQNNHHILITSRNLEFWQDTYVEGEYLHLNAFSREESILFLLRSKGISEESANVTTEFINKVIKVVDEESEQDHQMISAYHLAKHLEYHPLALGQAATIMRNKKISFDEHITNISKIDQDQNITNLIFRNIQQQNDLSYRVSEICGFLNNEEITHKIIKDIILHLAPQDTNFDDVINVLISNSIFIKNKKEDKSKEVSDSYIIHETAQEETISKLKNNPEYYKEIWVKTLTILINLIEQSASDDTSLRLKKHLTKAILGYQYIWQKLDNNDKALLVSAYEKFGISFSEASLSRLLIIAKYGNKELFEWLFEENEKNPQEPKLKLQDLTRLLYKATESGNLDLCKLLIDKGADIHAPDKWDAPIIFGAIENNNIDLCNFLIQEGAQVSANLNTGVTTLNRAIANNNLAMCELLIKEGADVNAIDHYKHSILHRAIDQNNQAICELLIEKGAKIDDTALNKAVNNNNFDLCDLLVNNMHQNDGYQGIINIALDLAVKNRNLPICELLLEKGADVSVINELYDINFSKLLIDRRNLNNAGKLGSDVLYQAIESNNLGLVKWLILEDNEIDINSFDQHGRTPLYVAENKNHTEISDWLESRKEINVNSMKSSMTALYRAAESGDIEVTQWLIQKGADVNKIATWNVSILYKALESGNIDLYKSLTENPNIDIHPSNRIENWGGFLLQKARDRGSIKDVRICDFLLTEGIDVNITNQNGRDNLALTSPSPSVRNATESSILNLSRGHSC